MAGGRPSSNLLVQHFIEEGYMANKSGRKRYKCKYCHTANIENRESRPFVHLAKHCKSLPAHASDIQRAALMELRAKGAIVEDDQIVEVSNVAAPADTTLVKIKPVKKRKAEGQPPLNDFGVMPSMGVKQTDQANIRWLRFLVHANIPFQATDDPLLDRFFEVVRPSYQTPSRYVLSYRLLNAEAARVQLEEIDVVGKSQFITILFDGWEDKLRRSLYGTVASQLEIGPVILGLADQTAVRGNANELLKTLVQAMGSMGLEDGKNVVALTTDSPTVMRSLRRKFQEKFPWVIILGCFLHALNGIVGKISAHADIKPILTKNARIVSFFNTSHYWGGQLKIEAKTMGITRSLQTRTETRWYSMVLQGISLLSYRRPLTQICFREPDGYSKIADDVKQIIFDTHYWQSLAQLVKTCKPVVDGIGDLESREANLADCMLTLIRISRDMVELKFIRESENFDVWSHAKSVFNREFHRMNTDIHTLALFLHPKCRKLAVSHDAKGRTLGQISETALNVVQSWGWSKELAEKLLDNLKAYARRDRPFVGGLNDGRAWWNDIDLTPPTDYPIKTLALKILSIVPHSADVERTFSDLNGVQGLRRSRLSVDTFETLGKLRANYRRHFDESNKAQGKPTRRKHQHMHTRNEPGIDAKALERLLPDDTPRATPEAVPTAGPQNAAFEIEFEVESPFEGLEEVTPEELDVAFAQLAIEEQLEREETFSRDAGTALQLAVAVCPSEVYSFAELKRVESNEVSNDAPNDLIPIGQAATQRGWTVDQLLSTRGFM